jgi:hypothetical protein
VTNGATESVLCAIALGKSPQKMVQLHMTENSGQGTLNRWQFSLRALLVVMTLTAIAVAFIAKYHQLALLMALGAAWASFESGLIVEVVLALSKPEVFDRHAILATSVLLATGIFSLAVSALFWWAALSPRSNAPFWLPLIPALLSGAFGITCLGLIWTSIRRPAGAGSSSQPEVPPPN